MNILIYIPDISQSWGGIRQYSVALLKMLYEIKGYNYYIYHDKKDPEVLQAISDRPEFVVVTSEQINKQKRVKKNLLIQRFKGIPILDGIKFPRTVTLKYGLEYFCEQNQIQIIHCPYQYIPIVSNVKLITTLHDVQEIHFPEFFTAEERASRATRYLDYLRRADTVIVSYKHVKDDLIKYFNVPAGLVKTLLLRMDKLWFDGFSAKNIVSLPNNLDRKKYLLYPANAWKHKNHFRILEALSLLRDKENLEITMVFTGDFNNSNGKHIMEKCSEFNLENQVLFLGIVDENTLYSLYKKAFGVIIPTLYEAGSFPLMESILLSVPVICSNVTSLPETIEDRKFTFTPLVTEEIAKKIILIWCDENFRNQNIKQIQLQANKIKMSNQTHILKAIYEDSVLKNIL